MKFHFKETTGNTTPRQHSDTLLRAFKNNHQSPGKLNQCIFPTPDPQVCEVCSNKVYCVMKECDNWMRCFSRRGLKMSRGHKLRHAFTSYVLSTETMQATDGCIVKDGTVEQYGGTEKVCSTSVTMVVSSCGSFITSSWKMTVNTPLCVFGLGGQLRVTAFSYIWRFLIEAYMHDISNNLKYLCTSDEYVNICIRKSSHFNILIEFVAILLNENIYIFALPSFKAIRS